MAASVGYLVIDSIEPPELATFWCALLGVTVDATFGEGAFLVLSPTAGGPPRRPRLAPHSCQPFLKTPVERWL